MERNCPNPKSSTKRITVSNRPFPNSLCQAFEICESEKYNHYVIFFNSYRSETLVSFASELHSCTEVPLVLTEIEKTYVQAILHTISHIFSTYFNSFSRHCLTNVEERKVTFLYDSFSAGPESFADPTFYKMFFQTQIWKHYSTAKLKKAEATIRPRAQSREAYLTTKSARNSLPNTPRKDQKNQNGSPIKTPNKTPSKPANTPNRKVFVAIDLSQVSGSSSSTSSESETSESASESSSEDIEFK